jgi:hypothetical protein
VCAKAAEEHQFRSTGTKKGPVQIGGRSSVDSKPAQHLEFANCLVLMRGCFSVTMEIPGQQVRPQSQLIWAGIRHDLAPKL